MAGKCYFGARARSNWRCLRPPRACWAPSPSAPAATVAASVAGGLSIVLPSQVVWNPINIISQRVMVQHPAAATGRPSSSPYRDSATRSRRSFAPVAWVGCSMASTRPCSPTPAPHGGDSMTRRSALACSIATGHDGCAGCEPATASGAAALVTMPLDTVKTRL
jgi:solute carrier family 25, member 44